MLLVIDKTKKLFEFGEVCNGSSRISVVSYNIFLKGKDSKMILDQFYSINEVHFENF